MTVSLTEAGVIVLAGECPAEDAETLLQRLQARPDGPVDWSAAGTLHTAVLQVLMAARPGLLGACGDVFVRTWADVQPNPKGLPKKSPPKSRRREN
jgi:hypothetical protein